MANAADAVINGASDAVQYASQVGRLDFISALLAIIAILLVFSAIPAYLIIEKKSKQIARNAVQEIRDEACKTAEQLVIKKLEEELPGMVEDYWSIAVNAVDQDMANDIARAQEDGVNG